MKLPLNLVLHKALLGVSIGVGILGFFGLVLAHIKSQDRDLLEIAIPIAMMIGGLCTYVLNLHIWNNPGAWRWMLLFTDPFVRPIKTSSGDVHSGFRLICLMAMFLSVVPFMLYYASRIPMYANEGAKLLVPGLSVLVIVELVFWLKGQKPSKKT